MRTKTALGKPGRRRPARPMVALLLFALAGCTQEPPPAPPAAPGEPIPGLGDAERGRFLLGRALFERLATPEEGLGPLYNAERCSTCHDAPAVGGGGAAVPVLKASRFHQGVCSPLRELGGDNLQQRTTPALAAAGVTAEAVPPEATGSRYVVAPPLFGLGLLEAVPASALEDLADPGDADGDGISGRLPRLPDGTPARFGRKGDAGSVQDFVEQALLFELGFTSPRFPEEEGPGGAPLPPGTDPFPDPEMTADAVVLLTDFVRYLAPPAPAATGGSTGTGGPPTDGDGASGSEEGLFGEVGCGACHTPSLVTGPAPEPALSGITIRPYTDLLLHDLGYGAADLCTPLAAPGEYRTAPLWGLRYRRNLLHDGSATTVRQAIEAHGGEGAASRERFLALPEEAQERILRFLAGL